MVEPAEERFVQIVETASLWVEGAAALLLVCAAAAAFVTIVHLAATRRLTREAQKLVWLGLARWLVLSLEFQLAADLLHTAVTRTWTDIGHVAALALIRTFLSYSLEGDLEKLHRPRSASPSPDPPA